MKAAIQVDGVNGETMNKVRFYFVELSVYTAEDVGWPQISKVKAPLLKKWLQERGMKCSGRKTKEELVKMTAEFLRDTGTPFNPPS